MKIVYTLLLLIFSFCSWIHEGFAACASQGAMNTTSFKIDVGCMDVLGGGGNSASGGPTEILSSVIGRISDMLLFTIPVLAAISFFVAGYFYIFAVGDSEKASRAKTIIKWNIIAMLVAFFSYSIVKLISLLFT